MVRSPGQWEPPPRDRGITASDTPSGGDLSAAHHHPHVVSEIERAAATIDATAIDAMSAEDIAMGAGSWSAEQLIACRDRERRGAARAEVIAALERELVARVSGAGPSQTPPA